MNEFERCQHLFVCFSLEASAHPQTWRDIWKPALLMPFSCLERVINRCGPSVQPPFSVGKPDPEVGSRVKKHAHRLVELLLSVSDKGSNRLYTTCLVPRQSGSREKEGNSWEMQPRREEKY